MNFSHLLFCCHIPWCSGAAPSSEFRDPAWLFPGWTCIQHIQPSLPRNLCVPFFEFLLLPTNKISFVLETTSSHSVPKKSVPWGEDLEISIQKDCLSLLKESISLSQFRIYGWDPFNSMWPFALWEEGGNLWWFHVSLSVKPEFPWNTKNLSKLGRGAQMTLLQRKHKYGLEQLKACSSILIIRGNSNQDKG